MSPRNYLLTAVLLGCSLAGLAENSGDSETNLLQNGDFIGGTEFWSIAPNKPGVEVVRDPRRHDRWALKIPTEGGLFSLSQQLTLPAGDLTLSGDFQVLAPRVSKGEPVQIRVRFYNARGSSLIVAGRVITINDWQTVVIPRVNLPEEMRDRFQIQSNRGQGNVFIGPVFLTLNNDESARERYIMKLIHLRDELLSAPRTPGDPELQRVETEIKCCPATAVSDAEVRSELREGTWVSGHDVYLYDSDRTWSILPIRQHAVHGRWHIEGNQFVKIQSVGTGDAATEKEDRYTIILLTDGDFMFTDGDRVFHETRLSADEANKLVGFVIPEITPETSDNARWQDLLSPESRQALKSLGEDMLDVHRKLGAENARQSPGSRELEPLLKLLTRPSLPINERDLLGECPCESIDVTDVGIFRYSAHKCRVQIKDKILVFERLGGRAVVTRKGNLYRSGDSSFTFIGTRTPIDAEGDQGRTSESVGVLLRKSKNGYVMILDPSPRMYELYEIQK